MSDKLKIFIAVLLIDLFILSLVILLPQPAKADELTPDSVLFSTNFNGGTTIDNSDQTMLNIYTNRDILQKTGKNLELTTPTDMTVNILELKSKKLLVQQNKDGSIDLSY